MNRQVAAPQSAADTHRGRARIVFHLGLPKTGSTSIQAMLDLNRERLGEGVIVSPRDELTWRMRRAAVECAKESTWLRRRHRTRLLKKMVREIRKKKFNLLIVSDENLIGTQSSRLFEDANRADYGEFVAELDHALTDYDVSYVVYIREREKWHTSCYNQSVKKGKHGQTFDQWAKSNSNMSLPDQIIEQLKSRLKDRLSVIDMATEVVEGTFLGKAILMHAGLGADVIEKIQVPKAQNESLPPSAMQFLRTLEASGIITSDRERRKVAHLIEDNAHLFVRETPKVPAADTGADVMK